MKRRVFLRELTLAGGGLLLAPKIALAQGDDVQKLTILHTNDTHSRIDPFPMDSKFPGLGGVSARAKLVSKIRKEEEHVLLLDAGDIWQGTPYFNFYHGELEFKAMSSMQYDAATLGNHDFDIGIDGLVKQLPHANFPFLNTNYNVADTPLYDKIQEYKIFQFGNIRIGVTGVGVELEGLVLPELYGKIHYQNPIECAEKTALHLKYEENCHFVICLSHLGFDYSSKKVSDLVLGKNSKNIDMIIGGHTHTFLEDPVVVENIKGNPVIINQVGWGGVQLGRVDLIFDRFKGNMRSSVNREIFS